MGAGREGRKKKLENEGVKGEWIFDKCKYVCEGKIPKGDLKNIHNTNINNTLVFYL